MLKSIVLMMVLMSLPITAFSCEGCGSDGHGEKAKNPFSDSLHKESVISTDVINKIKSSTGISPVDISDSKNITGFYKVYDGNGIYYIRHDMKFLIRGSVYNLLTKEDITSKELISRSMVDIDDLKSLPAVTFGKGPLEMYVFTDPDCPICKVFEHEVSKTPELYTIHYLMRPLEKLHPLAKKRSLSILCSDDKKKAFKEVAMKQGTDIDVKTTDACLNDIKKINDIAIKYKVNGTPSIVSIYGLINRGALVGHDLESFLKFNPDAQKIVE